MEFLAKKNEAILKEFRNCVIRNDKIRLKDIIQYIHIFWRDLSVEHVWLCLDERIAIQKAMKETHLEDMHSTDLGNLRCYCSHKAYVAVRSTAKK